MFTATGVGCKQCPALVESRKQIVDGSGSLEPKVMFIAEAPGESEDATGLPFIGKSGHELRAALALTGLQPADYYFTNSVRCHPERNRDPSTDELLSCSGWLLNEVEYLKPPFVVLLGKIARRAWEMIEGDLSYSPVVESVQHPAAIMRKPQMRSTWQAALQLISDRALNRDLIEAGYAVPGWDRGAPDLSSAWLSADTETKDLEDEKHGNELVCSQFSDGVHAELYRPGQHPVFDHVYLWNAKYDANAIGVDLRDFARWDDPLLMAYVLRYPRVGLKILGPELTGLPMRSIKEILTGWDIEEKTIKITRRGVPPSRGNTTISDNGDGTYTRRFARRRDRNFAEALAETPDEATEYALLDSVVTARAAQKLVAELDAIPTLRRYYHEVEKPITPILYDAEQWGIKVNVDQLIQVGGELDEAIKFHDSNVRVLLDIHDENFKITSNRRLAAELQKIGVRLDNRTKGGDISVDTPSLLQAAGYSKKEELAQAATTVQKQVILEVLNFRGATKLKETYVTKLERDRDDRSRIHGRFNQAVAATNRLSSSDPNLQNIPIRTLMGARIRASFEAEAGWDLIKADFSALELRIFAHYIDDQHMKAAFAAGLNPHDLNAQAWGIERSVAKNFMFGTAYGMEARKAAITGGIPESKADVLLTMIRQQSPRLLTWPEWIRQELIAQGYLENLLGWRNYYPEFYSPIRSVAATALREAGNFKIQSTASSLVKRFMIAIDEVVRRYGARMLLQVHDEVVIESPKESTQSLCAEIDEIARGLAEGILSVMLELEIKIGASWHGGKVWKNPKYR